MGIDCHSKFFEICVHVLVGKQLATYRLKVSAEWGQLQVGREWVLRALAAYGIAVREEDLGCTVESTGRYHMPLCLAWKGKPSIINPSDTAKTRRKTDVLDADVGPPEPDEAVEGELGGTSESPGTVHLRCEPFDDQKYRPLLSESSYPQCTVEQMGFSSQVTRILKENGLLTSKQTVEAFCSDLWRRPGCGKTTFQRVADWINRQQKPAPSQPTTRDRCEKKP